MTDWLPEIAKITRHTRSALGKIHNIGLFKVIYVDNLSPLPLITVTTFLFTMIDRHTSWAEALPIIEISATSIQKISRFDAPEIIIMCRNHGIDHRKTTAYHPQCNEKAERFHCSIKEGLRAHPFQGERKWIKILPSVLFGLMSYKNTNSRVSPTQMLYGSQLQLL